MGFVGILAPEIAGLAIAFALFLWFLQVSGLADARNRVVRGGVEPPTFRFSGALSRLETKNANLSAAQLKAITAGQPPTRPS